MINLQKLTGENIVTYKKIDLPLNKHPLTRVGGQNLDLKSTDSSNAAGKSVLFTTIGSVLLNFLKFQASKGEKNTLLSSNKGFASVEFEKNGDHYKITQYQRGTTRWEIEKNNKKLEFRETKSALSHIRTKIFNISEQQFYSQVIVDGRSKSVLQAGTSKQRFDYFEDVFKLGAYDLLAECIAKDYSQQRQWWQEWEILTKELQQKRSELPQQDREELSQKQTEIEAKFNKLRNKIEELAKQLNTANTFIAVAGHHLSDKLLVELQTDLSEAQAEQTRINKLLEKAIRFEQQSENYKQVTQTRKQLQVEINNTAKSKLSLKELEQRYNDLEDEIAELQSKGSAEQDKYKRNLKITQKLNELARGNEKLFEKFQTASIKTVQKTIANNKAEKQNLNKSITALREHLENHSHDEASCPTCLRDLTLQATKTIIKTATTGVNKCNNNIQRLNALLQYKELFSQLQEQDPSIDLEEWQNEIKEWQKKNNKRRNLINKMKKRQILTQRLRDLPVLHLSAEKCPPPEVYKNLQTGIQTRIDVLQQAINVNKRLQKLDLINKYKSVEEAINAKERITEKLETYRPLIDKAQSVLNKLNNKLSVYQIIQKDVVRLQTILNDLGIKTKNIKIYEALRKAFGPKGLRKIKTVFFASKLQHNLNKYANLIYGEPIRFQINVSQTKLDILAERNGKITDIRSLSGAESTCFTLLMIICILPFIRSADRFNIIALDEIESGLDAAAKSRFIEKYLPALQQIVPHIWIISPQSEQAFYVPNAHKLTVVKKNKISALKEG